MGVLNNRGCFPCAPTNEETLDAPPQGRPPTNADEDDNQERGTHADTREDGRCHRHEEVFRFRELGDDDGERERAWLEENVFVRKGGWGCGCMSLTCCLHLSLFFKVCMTVSMLSDSAEATEDWRTWTEEAIPSLFLELPLALVLFLGAATRQLTLIYAFLVAQAYFLPALITEFIVVYTTNVVFTPIERHLLHFSGCSCLLQMYLVSTAYRLYRGGTEHRTVKRSRLQEWQYSTLCCRRFRFQGPTCCGGPLSCYLSVWAGISFSGLYVYVRENWSIKDPQIWAASVFGVCQLVWSAGLVLYLRSEMKLQRWDGRIEQYVPVRAHMWSTQRQKRWLLGAVYVHFLVNVAFLANVAIGALKLSVPETKYTTY